MNKTGSLLNSSMQKDTKTNNQASEYILRQRLIRVKEETAGGRSVGGRQDGGLRESLPKKMSLEQRTEENKGARRVVLTREETESVKP